MLVRSCFWRVTAVVAVILCCSQQGSADQVILDDLIVDGSACIGQDCVNGESFGFDTIRIKENNLRIRAVDTSSTASFPTRDWQLTFNDSSNGGLNKFSVDDIDGGRTPFTIEGGAPSHSLYVDDGGRLGLGTSTPVTDIHVKSGNTPTLRLEQDGSSGFTPQTWDVAGNEANFFVRDATSGSTLPFRIYPGAPSNALTIEGSTGDIGLGTTSPTANLHIDSDDDNNSRVLLDLQTPGANNGLEMVADAIGSGSFWIKCVATAPADAAFVVRGDGRMGVGVSNPTNRIDVNGGANCDGTTWNNASSRALKERISNLGADEALQAFLQLNPVKFHYKQNPEDQKVGFIAEDVPGLVANNARKTLNSMDIVGVLTRVVQEQQKSVEIQQQTISELNKRIQTLEAQSTPQK